MPAGVASNSIEFTAYGSRGKGPTLTFKPPKKYFMPRSVEHFTVRVRYPIESITFVIMIAGKDSQYW